MSSSVANISLLTEKGGSFSLVLPKTLKAGDYLVRHEIIALHLAADQGGAEFYPSCTQIRVAGSGTGVASDTVSFPGAYSDNDPGIFDPTVRCLIHYYLNNHLHPFPGLR